MKSIVLAVLLVSLQWKLVRTHFHFFPRNDHKIKKGEGILITFTALFIVKCSSCTAGESGAPNYLTGDLSTPFKIQFRYTTAT